ncbi:MAG: hypothetical protein AAB538_01955, partial [Patescibacteria group bacterium]
MKNLHIAVALLLLWSQSHAFDEISYENCSISAWGHFDGIKNYVLGVPLEKLKAEPGMPQATARQLERTYNLTKTQGVETAYMAAHVAFKNCSANVAKSKPISSLSRAESAYSECAYTSATRTNILLRIANGRSVRETKNDLPEQFHELVDVLY